MPFISNYILDSALSKFDLEADKLFITNREVVSFIEATNTYTVGVKTNLNISAPLNNSPSGRKVTLTAFFDGTITANGVASHFAIVSSANSSLLATGPLVATQVVTFGNIFSLDAMDIIISPTISS